MRLMTAPALLWTAWAGILRAPAPAVAGNEPRQEKAVHEERVSLVDLPGAVRDAIRRVAGRNAISELSKTTRAAATIYEAEYRAEGVEHSVKVAATGEVLEIEMEIVPARLPAEVRGAVERRFPGGVIREAEAVYVGEAASPTYYDIEVKAGRHKHELRLRPSGVIVDDDR